MIFGEFQAFILCSLYNKFQNAIGDELRFVFKIIVGLILSLENINDFLNEILYFTEPLCIKDYLRNQLYP